MLISENSQGSNTFKNKCTRRKRITMTETDEKSLEKSLNFNILTSTYPLNNSASKKVVVGLYYSKNSKCFKPFIQLLNSHYTHGLKLNSNTWSDIQNRFQDITYYTLTIWGTSNETIKYDSTMLILFSQPRTVLNLLYSIEDLQTRRVRKEEKHTLKRSSCKNALLKV